MKIDTVPTREVTITITGSLEEFTLLYDATRRGKRTEKQNAALEAFGLALGGHLGIDPFKASKPRKKRKLFEEADIAAGSVSEAPIPDGYAKA